ncbi:hypothetical protein [Nocardia brasiliensis]|uniref:hypothetical protein n=1 Tax=Nocardia brasiliensis TaxID=37326 RepID=UPI002453FC7D|nr:hypothetical protein [Nocardia brasiliensis]
MPGHDSGGLGARQRIQLTDEPEGQAVDVEVTQQRLVGVGDRWGQRRAVLFGLGAGEELLQPNVTGSSSIGSAPIMAVSAVTVTSS